MKGNHKMNKRMTRIVSLILAFLICMAFGVSAVAEDAENQSITRASDYLNYYSVYVLARSGGKVIIEFEVDGVESMDSVGVSRLVIQEKKDGKWTSLPTIWGSISNGLTSESTTIHSGNYTHEGTAGVEYRAIATVYAEKDGGSDSRTITTNSVTAK